MSDRNNFGSFDTYGYSSYRQGGGPQTSARSQPTNPSSFARLTETVSTNIQKITQNVAEMQRLINQIGTSIDSPSLRDKLHQTQHFTNQLAKETNIHIKELAHLPVTGTPSEQRQCKLRKERLMNDFTDALNSFQLTQRHEKDKEKESVQRARTHTKQYDPFADASSQEKLVPLETEGQASVQMEEDVDYEILKEREQSLRKLEADILDVNQIFKDLGMLVHEQGDVIDSIEANVENASVNVTRGVEQLQQARDYQSKARRKKCCILIIVLVILTILAIIIAVSVRH